MLLKSFKLLTKVGQEKNTPLGSIGSVLWGFDMLLEVLEKTREKYNIEKPEKPDKRNKNPPSSQKPLSHLATCIDHAHGLFSKYYTLTDKTEAYVVAMVLDPRQKYRYFEEHSNAVHLPDMYKKTQTMYKEFRIDNDVTASSSMTDSRQSNKRKVNDDDDDDDFDIITHRFEKNDVIQNELERYLKTSPLPVSTQEALSFDLIT